MSPAELTAIVSGAIFMATLHLLFRLSASRAFLATAVVPAVILLMQGIQDVQEQQKIYARKFDQQQWLSQAAIRQSVRREMIGDLLDGKRVMGMSREQVIRLLGAPDQTFSSQARISYPLGGTKGGAVQNCLYLTLELDGDKVHEWRVWEN
jgi:hypothetical protein